MPPQGSPLTSKARAPQEGEARRNTEVPVEEHDQRDNHEPREPAARQMPLCGGRARKITLDCEPSHGVRRGLADAALGSSHPRSLVRLPPRGSPIQRVSCLVPDQALLPRPHRRRRMRRTQRTSTRPCVMAGRPALCTVAMVITSRPRWSRHKGLPDEQRSLVDRCTWARGNDEAAVNPLRELTEDVSELSEPCRKGHRPARCSPGSIEVDRSGGAYVRHVRGDREEERELEARADERLGSSRPEIPLEPANTDASAPPIVQALPH